VGQGCVWSGFGIFGLEREQVLPLGWHELAAEVEKVIPIYFHVPEVATGQRVGVRRQARADFLANVSQPHLALASTADETFFFTLQYGSDDLLGDRRRNTPLGREPTGRIMQLDQFP